MNVTFIRHFHNPNRPENLPEKLIWQFNFTENDKLTELEIAEGWEILTHDEFESLQKLHEPLAAQYAKECVPVGQPLNYSKATFDKYKKRYFAVGDIIAQICAENEARLLNGEWSEEKIQKIISSSFFPSVTLALQSLAFSTAINAINASPDELIEADVKKRYIDIISVYLN